MTKKYKQLDRYYQKKYGISWKQRMDMWRDQKGRCALCGAHEKKFSKRLAVEHNHQTGKIRSLCCFFCNKFRIGRANLYWAKLVYEYMVKYDG